MRDESQAFDSRLHKWMAINDAQNDVEEYLTYQNVCLSFDLDQVQNARAERYETLIENSDEAEVTAVHELGQRLYFDATAPAPLYGNLPYYMAKRKRTSWNQEPALANDPAALVRQLQGSGAGCCWLRDEWQALRTRLEGGNFWQSIDRLKAIRLLGRQPIQANEDRRVAEIFVASHALRPVKEKEQDNLFHDLLSDMQEEQQPRYRRAVRARWPDLFRPRGKDEWKQMLLDLVDQNIEQLSTLLEVHEANADFHAERTVARLRFDPSPEGEVLRNYQMTCTNRFFRGIETYRRYKAGAKAGRREADPLGRQPMGPVRPFEGGGDEVQEQDRPRLPRGGPFGLDAGLDDWIERADPIDAGVGNDRDEMTRADRNRRKCDEQSQFRRTRRFRRIA